MGRDIGYKVTRQGRTIPVVMLADPTTGEPVGPGGGGGGGGGAVTVADGADIALGARNATAAPADASGSFSVLSALKRALLNGASILARLPDLSNNRIPIEASNVGNKFREAFEVYDPVSGDRWTEVRQTGDIITLDGNSIACSYLVISKDPLTVGESSITTIPTWDMPFELAFGLSRSQATLGQEFSVEAVSDETALGPFPDVAIATISQSASVLTVNTSAPHGLRPGMRFGVRDVSDSRLNYPSLVVATAPTDSQITATAGPGGTIPSATLSGANGSIFQRSAMGGARNGTSALFENATATNASFYVRSESGDYLPTGTVLGNHTVAVGSTASIQAINAQAAYAFQPTTQYRLTQMVDGIQWSDNGVDGLTAPSNRTKREQVVPDIAHQYRLRIRAVNNASLTRPVARIVSAVKTGTTTATITTDIAHGLTTNDFVNIFGVRDQAATAFPNLATAGQVLSGSGTTFTIAIGTAATVTSYGGYVSRVNGTNNQPGAIAQTVQTIQRTANVVTVVGSAAWAGLLIGDYVNLHGVRDNTTGADVGIDGAYRVNNVVTTSLVLERINTTVSPGGADIGLTNCGGGVIKRTDLRVSYIKVMDFERQRVELMSRPSTDLAAGAPVHVQGGSLTANQGGTWNITTLTTVTTVTTAGTPPVPATSYFLNSAATTNGALIITGTSAVQSFYATNIGATVAFVKLYNKATAPTVGTDVPDMIIPVPAAVSGVPGVASLPAGYLGYRFALGLGIAITGAVADNDTTAIAAGQVKVKLSRHV